MAALPTIAEIEAARARLDEDVITTPVVRWVNDSLIAALGADTQVIAKLELFQRTGTFKPRGALTNMRALAAADLARGVTAVSAGNHAIAIAYGARRLGTSAKVVMPQNANPYRVEVCRGYGAEVVLAAHVTEAFDTVRRIEREEGRRFIHPFEGPNTILGTATVGLELCRQAPELDAVVVPIGGGGLCGGIASVVKQLQPACAVYGVEPVGAACIGRSIASGVCESIDRVDTIADSLGAPHATPFTLDVLRQTVDDVVLVDDDALRAGMLFMFNELKLAVEPAGAAALAALLGPLADRLRGKRVGLIICGTNTDPASHAAALKQALAAAA